MRASLLAFLLLAGLPALRAPAVEAAPAAAPAPAVQEVRNVILISWDGLDRSALKELLKAEKLPRLAALIKAGSLQDIDVKGHQTETMPGHAEMLTGLSAETTGISENAEPVPAVPAGYTVFERLRKSPATKDVFNVMVTAKEYVGTIFPEAVPALDVRDLDYRAAPANGEACLAALEKAKGKRFFAFFHFRDPDANGHGFGSGSREYRAAAETCDEWLGKVQEVLKQQKIDDRTIIYVMADHGFDSDSRSHSKAPGSWLATNDKEVVRGGILADIPATVMKRFGLDLDKLTPKLLGKPLTEKAPAGGEKSPGGKAAAAPVNEPVPAPATQ